MKQRLRGNDCRERGRVGRQAFISFPQTWPNRIMTVLRVGPNAKYTDGWAAAFGGKKGKKEAAPTTTKSGAKATIAKAKTAKATSVKASKPVTAKATAAPVKPVNAKSKPVSAKLKKEDKSKKPAAKKAVTAKKAKK